MLQQVRIDGFTETGSSGITALSFGSQTQDSAVTQLGWRGSWTLGNWQPFADVEWNHELADKNRTITASLTSISGSVLVHRRRTGRLRLGHRIGRRLLPGQPADDVGPPPQPCSSIHRSTSYGGELGLNVSF